MSVHPMIMQPCPTRSSCCPRTWCCGFLEPALAGHPEPASARCGLTTASDSGEQHERPVRQRRRAGRSPFPGTACTAVPDLNPLNGVNFRENRVFDAWPRPDWCHDRHIPSSAAGELDVQAVSFGTWSRIVLASYGSPIRMHSFGTVKPFEYYSAHAYLSVRPEDLSGETSVWSGQS